MTPKNIDWDAVLADALAQGKGCRAVAKQERVSPSSVSQACKARGIKLNRAPPGPRSIPWDSVLPEALANQETIAALAKRLGVTPESVRSACRKRNICLHRSYRNPRKLNRRLDELFREAVIEGMSANAFCLENNISAGSLERLQRKHGFKLQRGPRAPTDQTAELAA